MYRIIANPADETLTILSLEDVETLNLSYEIYRFKEIWWLKAHHKSQSI